MYSVYALVVLERGPNVALSKRYYPISSSAKHSQTSQYIG